MLYLTASNSHLYVSVGSCASSLRTHCTDASFVLILLGIDYAMGPRELERKNQAKNMMRYVKRSAGCT